jgi:nucleoside-diphosphate-sugar epimerase
VDGVFHLAAQPGVRGSWGDTFARYVRDNILATQRLFEAAAPVGARVVMASSSSVYGNAEAYPTREDAFPRPISPYGVTKLACESLTRTYAECFGLETVVLRYFTVYGPRQRYVADAVDVGLVRDRGVRRPPAEEADVHRLDSPGSAHLHRLPPDWLRTDGAGSKK